MKAQSIERCEIPSLGVSSPDRLRAGMVTLAVLCLLYVFPGLSGGQGPVRGKPATESTGTDKSEKTYAPIGNSGYKVRIPEFRLKRIIGDQPKRKGPVRGEGDKSTTTEAPSAETKPAEPRPSGPPPRLPFDHGPVAPSAPAHPTPPSAVQPAPTPAPVEESRPDEPSETPSAQESRPTEHSLKEQLRPGGPKKEPAVKEGPAKPEAPGKESQAPSAPAKESPSPVFAPPRAPEDVVKPPPPPKKEILAPEKEKIPPLLGVQASKSQPPAGRVEPVEVDDMADPRRWLPFASRGEPKSVTPPEPEPTREVSAEPEPAPSPGPESQRAALPESRPEPTPVSPPKPQARLMPTPSPASEPEPMQPPEPTPTPEPAGIPESRPAPQPVPEQKPEPAAEPAPAPETKPTPESQPVEPAPEPAPTETKPEAPDAAAPPEPTPTPAPAPPPKEVVPSPLDDGAVTSAEVRDYLRATAPILEELSLLMTRGPSLAVSDYDPSDSNAPVVPKQVHLQMEWMKRELQVLELKTFAIIPPKEYLAFHDLVRQSIAQTYQACDAVMAYLAESKPEDLEKVRRHLLKARDLIHRTTEKTGTS